MSRSIKYCCNTSILYNTPDEYLGFWYKNLKTAYTSLTLLPPGTTELEKSNMLLKLRETIFDQKETGLIVTAPAGISLFPHNIVYINLCRIFTFPFL